MATFDLCIGNAIVDIISRTDESLSGNKRYRRKGAMNLIDADQPELFYGRIPSGNVRRQRRKYRAAGVASLGGRSAYFGKVATDHLGRVSRMTSARRALPSVRWKWLADRLFRFSTPDGGTLDEYLLWRLCVELWPEDVETSAASDAKVTYFEGYLVGPAARQGSHRPASKIAHEKNQMAMTLSDPFWCDPVSRNFCYARV